MGTDGESGPARPAGPTFNKVVDYFLRTQPQPKNLGKPADKRRKRKDSDRVVSSKGAGKQRK